MKFIKLFKHVAFGILILPLATSAQQSKVDSLFGALKSEKDDTTKVSTLIKLSIEKSYIVINYSQADSFAQEALHLAEKLNFKRGMGTAYLRISDIFFIQGNFIESLKNGIEALKKFQEIGDKYGVSYVDREIGYIYYRQSNYTEAMNYILQSLKLDQGLGDKDHMVTNYGIIGNIYEAQGNYQEALKSYLLEMSTSEETNSTGWTASAYNDIGRIYEIEGNYKEALKNQFQALEIFRRTADISISEPYKSIGSILTKEKKYTTARAYLDSALKISIYSKYKVAIKEDYYYLALLDSTANNYKEYMVDYKNYIMYRDSVINESAVKKQTQMEMNFQFEQQEEVQKAEQAQKDMRVAADKKKQVFIIWSVCAGLLLILVFSGILFNRFRITQKQKKIIEEQKGKVELAYKNLEILNDVSNEITSTLDLNSVMSSIYDNISRLMDVSFFIISAYNEAEQSVKVKFCVKEGKVVEEDFKTLITNSNSFTALTIKNKKEIIILDLDKEYSNYLSGKPQLHGKEDTWQESIIMIPLLIQDNIIGLFSVQSPKKHAYSKSDIEILRSLSTVIAVALNNAESYNKLNTANVEISKQKQLIEEKNKEVLDSITYAKRLQDAILPPLSIIKKYLPDSFLLYKPKDIVAGDFYWLERAGENILIAACDCTGHGVPGAMVSVVCSNALNSTVKEFKITEPGKILDKVRELLLETFEKSESDVQDGMDISLCCLNTQTKEIQWSGANNPLWYIQNGELKEVAPDKQPIGKQENPKPFNTVSLKLQKGDTLYLFTDGYADQFGGPKGKKFKYKQLQEKLLAMGSMDMDKQRNMLDETIGSWKGSLEQVDDILIMGIRV